MAEAAEFSHCVEISISELMSSLSCWYLNKFWESALCMCRSALAYHSAFRCKTLSKENMQGKDQDPPTMLAYSAGACQTFFCWLQLARVSTVIVSEFEMIAITCCCWHLQWGTKCFVMLECFLNDLWTTQANQFKFCTVVECHVTNQYQLSFLIHIILMFFYAKSCWMVLSLSYIKNSILTF